MNMKKTADLDGPKGCSSLNLDLMVYQIQEYEVVIWIKS